MFPLKNLAHKGLIISVPAYIIVHHDANELAGTPLMKTVDMFFFEICLAINDFISFLHQMMLFLNGKWILSKSVGTLGVQISLHLDIIC